MKKQSSTMVFSDCECPYCSQTVNYDKLYQKFFEFACPSDFEYLCPHCGKLIQINVEPVPTFSFEVIDGNP